MLLKWIGDGVMRAGLGHLWGEVLLEGGAIIVVFSVSLSIYEGQWISHDKG